MELVYPSQLQESSWRPPLPEAQTKIDPFPCRPCRHGRNKFKYNADRDGQIIPSNKIYLHNTVDEGTFGKGPRAVDRFAVIFRAPRGAINVYMVGIKAERSRFNGIVDCTIQHTNAADAGIKSDAHSAIRIESNGRHFAGASSSVLIVTVISWHRVAVVIVDIRARQGILISTPAHTR